MRTQGRIPFLLDRSDRRGLVSQFVNGVKEAVADGVWKPGDVLPTWREFAETLGVSLKVPREAFAQLVADGVVGSRRHSGTVVLSHGERSHNRRIVIAVGENSLASFHTATVISVITSRLSQAGYFVEIVPCPQQADGRDAMGPVECALKRPIDLLISMVWYSRSWLKLNAWKLPPVIFVGDAPVRRIPGCGRVAMRLNAANSDLVAYCRRQGVRKVLEIGLSGGSGLSVQKALKLAHIRCDRMGIAVSAEKGFFENLITSAMQTFGRYLANARRRLPDLIMIDDDFIAIGVFNALLAAGVSVPRDVRVVTFSNRGFGPVFPVPLPRIEMDAYADGQKVAEAVCAYLERGKLPEYETIQPVFRDVV